MHLNGKPLGLSWFMGHYLHLLPGLVVVGMVLGLKFLGFWQGWELAVLDWGMRSNPAEPPDDRVVIIGIDEADIRAVGYPFPDGTLAKLLEEVQSFGPRAIGIDIFRDLPVEPGTDRLRRVFQTMDNVIGIEKSVLPNAENPVVYPPPDLPPAQIGFADVLLDRDGNIRRALLSSPGVDGIYRFSFATRLAEQYLKAEGISLENGIRDRQAFRFGSTELTRFTGNQGGYVQADAGGNQILINWRRRHRFGRISWRDFQARRFDPARLRQKIVLIGYTAPFSAKDTFSADGVQQEDIFGVEFHAHTISQIISAVLDRRPLLRPLGGGWEYGWIILWGGLGITLALFCRSPWQMYLGLVAGGGLLVVLSSSLLIFHIWIPIVPAFLTWMGATLITRNVNDFRAFLAQQQLLLDQRQQTLDDAFNAMHNGPLHTLAEMISTLKMDDLNTAMVMARLENLDKELRTVYESLRPEYLEKAASTPLHELLYEVYHRTMQRDFACFRSLKIKIPDIHPVDDRELSGEIKRELCDFLEESLCNVGKHATGATRLTVTCKQEQGKRWLRVIDNGIGIPIETIGQKSRGGTHHAFKLAKQLRGTFQRRANAPRGTICELIW